MMDQILGTYVYERGITKEKAESMPNFPGESIYEWIRVSGGYPVFLKDHLERLNRSLTLAGWTPFQEGTLVEILRDFLKKNNATEGSLRLVYVPAEGEKGLYLYLLPAQLPDESLMTNGARLLTYQAHRANPHIKTVAQSYKDLLKTEEFQGIYELLLVDDDGTIREGSRTNVFFIRKGELITPPAQGVLPGITRRRVMEICKAEGFQVLEETVTVDDLGQMEGLFLTGTATGILPVSEVNGKAFDFRHPILRKLQEGYRHKEEEDRLEIEKRFRTTP